MSTTWDGLPEEGKDTEVLLDEVRPPRNLTAQGVGGSFLMLHNFAQVVSNGAEEDFDDSYLYTFTSKKGGGYSVCILNDM